LDLLSLFTIVVEDLYALYYLETVEKNRKTFGVSERVYRNHRQS
jgi:hypothetical protein